MKLATLKNGRPDGQLVVALGRPGRCVSAGRIAPTLQAALDDWTTHARRFPRSRPSSMPAPSPASPSTRPQALAPLPRAYQWIDGAGYLSHLERVRSLKGSKDDELQSTRPLLYQGGSDSLSAPTEPIRVTDPDLAIDFEAEVAVIIGPVPMGASKAQAAAAIRLVTVCNDVSLRRLVVDDLQNGFGFFHAKPSTSLRAHRRHARQPGRRLARQSPASAGPHRGQRHPVRPAQCRHRHAFRFRRSDRRSRPHPQPGCGTIIGGGTVSNRHDESLPIKSDGIGFACIAEARTVEKLKYGRARTPFLKPGDTVRIGAMADGKPTFGDIFQTVVLASSPSLGGEVARSAG